MELHGAACGSIKVSTAACRRRGAAESQKTARVPLHAGGSCRALLHMQLLTRRPLARPPRLVQGLRPWISAPCSLLLCAIADRLGIHRPLLLACFLISASLRGSLALVTPHFATVAVLILTADAVAAPVAVIADSSVVAKCVKDGEYGKQR